MDVRGAFVEPGRCRFELQHSRQLSRGREIDRRELAKLHRMQFGRKSEKLQRQIKQFGVADGSWKLGGV